MSQELQKFAGGQIQTAGFGEGSLTPYAETQARAVAAREQAGVQARYIVAMQNRRNLMQFRNDLKMECHQPSFAAVARYAKPMGGATIEGPSIRFVEAALRHFRNTFTEVSTVFDDERLRICRVVVADLETNDGYATEVQVLKTVERKGFKGRGGDIEPPKGREVVGQRINSYGDPVFICTATDDEVITKQNALVSKAIRTQGLRLLPGGIVDEMQQIIIAVTSKQVVDDPTAALKQLVDAFVKIGVQPVDLEAWAGRPLDRLTPKDLLELRGIWTAIKDGEATWKEIVGAKQGDAPAESKKADKVKLFTGNRTPEEGKSVEGGGDAGSGPKQPEAAADTSVTSGQTTDPAPAPEPARGKYVTAAQVEQIKAAIQANDMPRADIYAGLQQICGTDRVEFIPVERFAVVMDALKPQTKEAPDLTEAEMEAATARADAKKGGRLKL